MELTDAQWQIADAVARQLVIDGTDVNELRKAIAYLREYQERPQAGKLFFDYLKTLVRQGDTVGHSKKTVGYYRSLDAVCSEYLTDYQNRPAVMLYLLGWAARLAQYYGKGVPTGEIARPEVISEREAELKAFSEENKFEVGQKLAAKVAAIKKGNKVTYEILETIRLTQKEVKLLKANALQEGQEVTVEVSELKDDGSIKKIKLLT